MYDRLAELIRAAPHDADLRQPAPHRRARRAPPRRAARRGARHRAPRQPGARAPAAGRAAAEARRAEGAGGDQLARARHRHRRHRPRVPARLAARDQRLPAARGPRRPCDRRDPEGPAVPALARRPARMRRAARRGARAASSTASACRTSRSTCWRSRSSPRRPAANGRSMRCTSCCRRAQPYRELTLREFEQVVQMLADGYSTRRGRRGAYLHYDAVNRVLRARRGARLDRRHQRRRDPRPVRLRRGAAARRAPRRHAQRGLRVREPARRHLPARQHARTASSRSRPAR